jgi:hypothetical protein
MDQGTHSELVALLLGACLVLLAVIALFLARMSRLLGLLNHHVFELTLDVCRLHGELEGLAKHIFEKDDVDEWEKENSL